MFKPINIDEVTNIIITKIMRCVIFSKSGPNYYKK